MASGRRAPDGLTDLERDVCHAVDKGLTNREVYRAVRPDSKASDLSAEHFVWRVRKRPQCVAYLKKLKAQAMARHLDAKDDIIAELAVLAFADIGDLLVSGPDGLTVKPIDELPPELRRAVAGLSISRTAHGIAIRLRMHDKIRALDKLCHMFGLYDRENRPGADERAKALSDVERAQRLAAILRMADGKGTGEGEGEAS